MWRPKEEQRPKGWVPPRIVVAAEVTRRFTCEIVENPRVEVGGKYVGFITGGARHKTLKERHQALRDLVFEVTDYLDDGPGAQRSASFHLGDAEWQTAEFRKLESRHPDIEQLGSWHSHHPNGLRELSRGDIIGYHETVDDPGHNHDYFLVSLGIDLHGFRTARHYLFIREDPRHYEIPGHLIEVGDLDTETAARDHAQREGARNGDARDADARDADARDGGAGIGPETVRTSPSDADDPTSRPLPTHEYGPDDRRGSWAAGGREEAGPVPVPGWSEVPEGRRVLQEEYRLLGRSDFAGLRMMVNEGRLIATGQVEAGGVPVTMSLLYPSAFGLQDGLLKLACVDPPVDSTLSGPYAVGLRQAHAAVPLFAQYVRGLRPDERNPRHPLDWLKQRFDRG